MWHTGLVGVARCACASCRPRTEEFDHPLELLDETGLPAVLAARIEHECEIVDGGLQDAARLLVSHAVPQRSSTAVPLTAGGAEDLRALIDSTIRRAKRLPAATA